MFLLELFIIQAPILIQSNLSFNWFEHGLRLNHERKLKLCGEIQCNAVDFQINVGAERCKIPPVFKKCRQWGNTWSRLEVAAKKN